MVLSQQLFARVAGNLAELVVDVRDDAALIGEGDDGSLVEGLLQRLELIGGVIGGPGAATRRVHGAALVRLNFSIR